MGENKSGVNEDPLNDEPKVIHGEYLTAEEHVPLVPPMSLKDFKRKMAKMSADKERSMAVRVAAFGLGALSQHLLDASAEVLGTGAPRKKGKK